MALDYFVGKFYSIPQTEKDILKKFLLSEEIDKWIMSIFLLPVDNSRKIIAAISTNNLSIFDVVEVELSGDEIEFSEYAKALKKVGTEYAYFYPSFVDSAFL